MIKSWKHKGLQQFFKTGSRAGIVPQHERRLKIILQQLNAAVEEMDMHTPGMQFPSLKGKRKDYYAVSVNGNWRVIFKFEKGNAIEVDYLDYH